MDLSELVEFDMSEDEEISEASDLDEDIDPDKIEVPGGGRDLENAAVLALEENIATTSRAVAAKPAPKINITSPYLSQPIKITIPATATSATSIKKHIIVKSVANVSMADGKQIKFIPPKVNTANNRVPPEERFQSTGPGERK